jgi:imidazoleglycerol-phosphate dehydratase
MARALRRAGFRRTTRETDIRVRLDLDGRGRGQVATGIGFFDHMLDTLARHGAFDLTLAVSGDLHVDQHHTVEDTGLVLGEAVRRALGSKRGILRAGWWVIPMDEALALAAVDLGGRAAYAGDFRIGARRVGGFETELLDDFFGAFAQAAGANVHLRLLAGRSSHHKVEALFKAFARALRVAVSRDRQMRGVVPSTKGLL